ncbi:hypothetical protein JXB01_02040 [Candidatus Micrarchaeota archaeon]|nr:hypothetical protein [Candidatus Micrarchaeota archaeon]
MHEQENEKIEELRMKKLQQEQMLQKIKSILRIALDESAYDRMSNIYAMNKELFSAVSKQVIAVYQRLGRRITEKELIMIINKVKGPSHEGSISIKRK